MSKPTNLFKIQVNTNTLNGTEFDDLWVRKVLATYYEYLKQPKSLEVFVETKTDVRKYYVIWAGGETEYATLEEAIPAYNAITI